ncbi:putative oxidoreductase TDA3 [Cryptomeria japonica]|uniref:putative oxidoreductase TDA3 n=1 Tax=Cryptomeria japonica TaxID=3369 RepID=UPI0027DA9B14|nr:putative oxidoreductase TDA3 [Cryptomeria japonica]
MIQYSGSTKPLICNCTPIPIPCLLRRKKKSRYLKIHLTTMQSSSSSSSADLAATPKKVIVCGADVIGACTAYFLAQKGAQVTVVEKSAPACAASGKAGGFLALDWCDRGPLSALARHSFHLHGHLADLLSGTTAYAFRRLETLALTIQEAGLPKRGVKLPEWVDGPATRASSIGTTQTTAQLHPYLFTRKILDTAVEKYGVNVAKGEVKEVSLSDGNVATGVVMDDGEVLLGECVVLAMGPWSAKFSVISGLCRISGVKAHSIVVRPQVPEAIGPHALFLSYKTTEGVSMDPEVYPRPTGEVYICGMSEEVEVPDDPQQIQPRKESIRMLQRVAQTVSSHLGNAELQAEQACFLPYCEDGRPVIGKIPDMVGVYVATGHSCWGILNAPATGESLAELIIDGQAKSVDLKPFDPVRFKRAFKKVSVF